MRYNRSLLGYTGMPIIDQRIYLVKRYDENAGFYFLYVITHTFCTFVT